MCLVWKSIRQTAMVFGLPLLALQTLSPPAIAYGGLKDFTLRTPVSEAVLASMRGGFQRHPDGPFMSFGIERNVFDNGKLISSTVLKIPDMARFANRDWNPLSDGTDSKPSLERSSMKRSIEHSDVKLVTHHSDMKPEANPSNDTFTLIQSGPGNSLPHDVSSLSPFTTIIQNSLDNRAIRTETVIDVTVKALTWARAQDLGAALSLANIEAIRH